MVAARITNITFQCTWCCYLKGHELVVWLGCPCINFHRTLQSNYEKLDSFIFYWKIKWEHKSVSTWNSKFFGLSSADFINMTSLGSSKQTGGKCWLRSSLTVIQAVQFAGYYHWGLSLAPNLILQVFNYPGQARSTRWSQGLSSTWKGQWWD